MDRLNGLAVSESAHDPAEFASVIAIPTLICEGCLRGLSPHTSPRPGDTTLKLFCDGTQDCVLRGLILEVPLMRMRAKRVGYLSQIARPG